MPSVVSTRSHRLFRRFAASTMPATEGIAHQSKPLGVLCKEAENPVVVNRTLMVCVPPVPEKLKLAGVALQAAPAGSPLQEKDPDPVNPGAEDNNKTAVPLLPALTDTWLRNGSALRLKSATPVPLSWTM